MKPLLKLLLSERFSVHPIQRFIGLMEYFVANHYFNYEKMLSGQDPCYDSSELHDLEKRYGKEFLEQGMNLLINWYSENRSTYREPLGDIYMKLSSKYKSSALGQFFTPHNLSDHTALITPPDPDLDLVRVCDPCTGSSRMLLSYYKNHLRNRSSYIYAQDVDLVCVNMSLVNFAGFRIAADVCWGNSLVPSDNDRVFRVLPFMHLINPEYHLTLLNIDPLSMFKMAILEIPPANSYGYTNPVKPKPHNQDNFDLPSAHPGTGTQLTLF